MRFMAISRTINWLFALNKRERIFVWLVLFALIGFGLSQPIEAFVSYLSTAKLRIEKRKLDLESLQTASNKYRALEQQLSDLRKSFLEKQVSLEQVYNELDSIVKNNVGNDAYELKRREVTESEFGYEQHDFQLMIKELSLEQLVKILFELESGTRPLFLKKVSISAQSKGSFEATLLLYSIQEKKEQDKINVTVHEG